MRWKQEDSQWQSKRGRGVFAPTSITKYESRRLYLLQWNKNVEKRRQPPVENRKKLSFFQSRATNFVAVIFPLSIYLVFIFYHCERNSKDTFIYHFHLLFLSVIVFKGKRLLTCSPSLSLLSLSLHYENDFWRCLSYFAFSSLPQLETDNFRIKWETFAVLASVLIVYTIKENNEDKEFPKSSKLRQDCKRFCAELMLLIYLPAYDIN